MFVFLILSCRSFLYILEINLLSVTSFTVIFSHSENCLFILFILSFAVQKLLSFIRFHLFVFISINLGGGSERILLWFMSKCTQLMFSSNSFIVSGLKFKSLIHFEFIFVYGVRKCYNFFLFFFIFFFTHNSLVFPAPVIEVAVFSPLYIFASFVKDKVTVGV